MKIYKLKKDWGYVIGNGSIGFHMNYKKGSRFFKPTDLSKYKTIGADFYPENGSYAVAEKADFKFVDEYLELIGETNKPLEYFINKKYSQEEFDKLINK